MADSSGKQVTICDDIFDTVKALADNNNIEVETLVNHILKKYLEDRLPSENGFSEKRKFRRKKIIIPALIYEKFKESDTGRYVPTTVLDISIGGARLAIPLERKSRIEFVRNSSEFEVVLYLSDGNGLSRFKCQVRHVDECDQAVKVGGSFQESDEYSHQQLDNFLRQ